jgi:hypothetical protein
LTRKLVSEILSHCLPAGLAIDRIIGYGSYFWGGYCPDTSDIDLTVIVCRTDGRPVSENELACICAPVEASCLVIDVFEIESYRNLMSVMYGKLLGNGIVLYANDETREIREAAKALAMPYLVARDIYAGKCHANARLLMTEVINDVKFLRGPPSRIFRVAAAAQTAAMLMLWSVLYEADIDPSDKTIRWDFHKLLTVAAALRPELTSLIRYAKGLPSESIAKEIGYCNNSETRRIVRIALCLMQRICNKGTYPYS